MAVPMRGTTPAAHQREAVRNMQHVCIEGPAQGQSMVGAGTWRRASEAAKLALLPVCLLGHKHVAGALDPQAMVPVAVVHGGASAADRQDKQGGTMEVRGMAQGRLWRLGTD